MSKDLAQVYSRPFSSLFADALRELFAPSSDKSLVDYSSLELVDLSYFRFIDKSKLKLINFASLMFGLKYVAFLGAYLLVIGGFGLTYLSIKVEESNYKLALARDHEYRLAMLNKKYQNLSSHPVGVVYAKSIAYLNNQNSRVLGVSDTRMPKTKIISRPNDETAKKIDNPLLLVHRVESIRQTEELSPACSFTVNGDMYASGSALQIRKPGDRKICVNHAGVSVDWYIHGKSNTVNNSNDCYVVPSSDTGTVVVNVFDANSTLVGSCSLKLSK